MGWWGILLTKSATRLIRLVCSLGHCLSLVTPPLPHPLFGVGRVWGRLVGWVGSGWRVGSGVVGGLVDKVWHSPYQTCRYHVSQTEVQSVVEVAMVDLLYILFARMPGDSPRGTQVSLVVSV